MRFKKKLTFRFADYNNEAKSIWKIGKGDNRVMRAWAVFVLSHQGFSGQMGGSWGYSDQSNMAKRFDKVK